MPADKIVREYVYAVDRKDPIRFAALFAVDAVLHDPFFPEPTTGRDALQSMIEGILRASPDMAWKQLGDPIDAGGQVAFVVSVEGTNDGPLAMRPAPCHRPGSQWHTKPQSCGRSTRMD